MEREKKETYEDVVKRRRAENMAFLESLGIEELKKEARSLNPPKQKRPKPAKRELKLKEPVRRSSRLKNIPPEAPSFSSTVTVQGYPDIREPKPRGTLTFDDHTFHSDESLTATFLEDCSTFISKHRPEKNSMSLSGYKKKFQSMKINSSLIAKIAPNRIVAISIHPSLSKRLVAVGSKYGQVSFWDVDKGSDGIYIYEPHSERVSCVEFSPHNAAELYSVSFDGTLRCADLEKGVFYEVYRTSNEDDDLCSSFDILSPFSFLISHRSGTVTIADKRTDKKKGESLHQIEDSLKTVHSHPMDKCQFVSAARNSICIWDLRHMKKCTSEYTHPKYVNSAYFSPVTGKYILSTSLNHKLNVFDVLNDVKIKMKTSIPHDNFTGRWLTPFRAVWLPNNEDAFLAGSTSYPRRIQVFHVDGQLEHEFRGEDLGSICSVNAFHPSQPFLAGGNSSGKVHVFCETT